MTTIETEGAAGITILARPNGRGRYDALYLGETLVKSSNTPFLAGCRALLARGFDPNAVAVMRHEGSNTDSLRGRIRKAAQLTGIEATTHRRARFAPYRPFPDSEANVTGRPPVRVPAEGATEVAEAAE